MINIFVFFSIFSMFLYVFWEIKTINSIQVIEHQKVNEISLIIKKAAIAYLFSQLKVLILVEIIIAALLYYFLNLYIMITFVVGAILSWICGFLAMYFSVTYNKKVALCAIKGYKSAFLCAFSVGKIVAILVNAIALSCCYLIYLYSVNFAPNYLIDMLLGLSFGASLISVFARIGGGIFTKGADIGADLVGKNEQNIPEDDPRNPAVIADAVGDNVGDACGMSADLFETFVVITGAAVAIVSALSKNLINYNIELVFVILASGAISSLLVLITGWYFNESDYFSSLNIAFKTMIISLLVISGMVFLLFGMSNIFSNEYIYNVLKSVAIGVFCSVVVMLITEYYTSSKFNPVLKIAQASKQGHANNIIQGLSVGYAAVFINVICISISLLAAYECTASLSGVVFACVGMISICAVILALDVFGPVTDNAGGLVEMAQLDKSVRIITDKLDMVGNMTKATTKGYSVFSASLAAYVLLLVFFADYQFLNNGQALNCSLDNIFVFIGLFVGMATVSLFASQCLLAVNNASMAIIKEVRHQFATLKILEREDEPDYKKAIDILTIASLKEMIIPSLMPIFCCLSLFFMVLRYSNKEFAFLALAGFIVGATITGVYTAISMTISGGAWDNAKKHLESLGQKGTNEHKAAVTGDTVGDPFKDTAGPSFNPMLKLIGIISILLLKAVF